MTDIIWDRRPLYVFQQTSEEKYKIIEARYNAFIETVNDMSKDPMRVFDPLKPVILEELSLIREVSKELQIKKDEDIRKQQAAEKEEEKKEDAEVKEVDEQIEAEMTDA